jgi:hypothetical protein
MILLSPKILSLADQFELYALIRLPHVSVPNLGSLKPDTIDVLDCGLLGMDWKKKREWLMPSWSTPILLGSPNNCIFIAKKYYEQAKPSLAFLILSQIYVSLRHPRLELNVG